MFKEFKNYSMLQKYKLFSLLTLIFILVLIIALNFFAVKAETYPVNNLTENNLMLSKYPVVYAEDKINLNEVVISEVVSGMSLDEYGFIHPVLPEKLNIDTDNLVFVGNSLVVGLQIMGNQNNVYLCKGGISLLGLKSDIYRQLTKYSCDNVVIGMGTNELGSFSEENFKVLYKDLIEHIRSINPNANIICLSIPPVSENRSRNSSLFNNENVQIYNQYTMDICDVMGTIYIDCSEFFGDVLDNSWSGDGIHFTGTKYMEWYNFIVEKISEL